MAVRHPGRFGADPNVSKARSGWHRFLFGRQPWNGFSSARRTVAALQVFVGTRARGKGVLDHIPTDVVEQLAPALAEHRDRIAADPRVAAYYAR